MTIATDNLARLESKNDDYLSAGRAMLWKRNVVFLCSEYPPALTGGIGIFTRGLAEALALRGNEVHVVGLYETQATIRQTIDNVHVIRLSAASGWRALIENRVRIWRELRRIIGIAGPIDILEAPDFEGVAAGLPRCSRVRVVRLHGSHRYFADERQIRHSASVSFFEKLALRQADAVVSVSEYTADRTRELFGLSGAIRTIHNAVNVPKHFARKDDYREARRAVYFGTLAEKKGVLPLATAWRMFVRRNPGWHLTVIGRDTGSGETSMKARMLQLLGDARNTVEFGDFLPNERVLAKLSTFDFAVLPSFSEAFALAPIEAMALGLPVVYSSLSSGKELITDNVDGWLCDPRSVDDLAQAITRAAASTEDRERIGRNARAKAENQFGYERFVQRNLDFYNELLQQNAIKQ